MTINFILQILFSVIYSCIYFLHIFTRGSRVTSIYIVVTFATAISLIFSYGSEDCGAGS
jgi:hypothetical protein